jgi:hypothetical protein
MAIATTAEQLAVAAVHQVSASYDRLVYAKGIEETTGTIKIAMGRVKLRSGNITSRGHFAQAAVWYPGPDKASGTKP